VISPSLVQDCINACVKLDRERFIEQLEVPVLISEERRAGFTFTADQTRLIKREKRTPLARDLIRAGNQLPVLELRQRQLGPPGQVRVGRSAENDLVIKDDTVSSRHAVFQKNDRTGTYDIHDLASMNGTWVNGSRLVVGKSVVLFDGDVLGFGDTVFLFFYPAGLYDVLKANIDSL
jgi:pSer/pThr/pTyr-binding forkhead associated (FHA) protein